MSTKKYILVSFVILSTSAILITLTQLLIGTGQANDFIIFLVFLWIFCAAIWVLFLPIEIYIAIKENDLNYLIQRQNKITYSLYSIFSSAKTRQKRFMNLLELNNIFASLNKEIFSKIINKRIAEVNVKLDRDKEMLNNEMNDKDIKMQEMIRLEEAVREKNEALISKKNEEIEILKKEIIKEKEIYKNLQGRHKYLDLWVKNR
tara:strand:- start:595 stop:1206 length:612 start_codon:yes stop_codon:yes gene_type:complete